MTFDPATFDTGDLFQDPGMFDSSDDWADEGFRLLRASDNKICVASHRSVDGYLFKKYVASGKRESLKDQLQNYQARLEGARRLRSLIDEKDLRHVAVPRKWLRELPSDFGSRKQPSHVLVVERLDILDDDETARAYGRIDDEVLRDLCVVLHAFRGLDSSLKNVPFTSDGRVAFIDTEHWERHNDNRDKRRFLKYLGDHLSSDSFKLARKMWDQLGDGDDLDDFEFEEDTSSSS